MFPGRVTTKALKDKEQSSFQEKQQLQKCEAKKTRHVCGGAIWNATLGGVREELEGRAGAEIRHADVSGF